MGNRGRFGKYGESKRLKRLRSRGGSATSAGEASGTTDRGKAGFGRRGQERRRTRIRPGGKKDAVFIRRLSEKVFGIYGPYGDLVPQWFATGATITRVASVDGVPAGFAMMGPAFHALSRRLTVSTEAATRPRKKAHNSEG